MTWQSVGDIAQQIVNADAPGCRDCGTVMEFKTKSGYTARYPGVECCPPAIRRQIQWRAGEIDQVKADIENRRKVLTELQQAVDDAPHTAREARQGLLAKATRAFESRMEHVIRPQLTELSTEIGRLKRKLAEAEGRAA